MSRGSTVAIQIQDGLWFPFNSENGRKETGVSSAHRPPGRCRSPPLWRPHRCSDLADKRFATSADKCFATTRPSSPPVWKPVPLSQSVLTPHLSVMKTNGLYGHLAQSTTRLQLAPPRLMFNGPMGLLPSIPPSTVLIEDVLTGSYKAHKTKLIGDKLQMRSNNNNQIHILKSQNITKISVIF